ncbi:hypothetical protein GUJ93_ZPchr0012g20409 [Zizania palustris]|uniref:Uncharacterized protein n=1 Tax=Zizania palustris TaxID=103762 RepID=A0A8J6BVL8_ZIZPA|nr:hypothetical protein GUJ93_ZPchr0012g20409 [Zizania palustris]
MARQAEVGDGGRSAAPANGRRSGRRGFSWSGVLCFGGCRGEEAAVAGTPRGRPRLRRRTVPVDGGAGDEASSAARAADRETRGGEGEEDGEGEGPRRRRGGCFLLPLSCVPGLKRRIKGSNSNDHHRQRQRQRQRQQQEPIAPPPPQNVAAPRAELPPRDAAATVTTRRGAIADTRAPTTTRREPATTPRGAGGDAASVAGAKSDVEAGARSCRRGEFGPAVGLSVVAAVSMAGLLGGRLWAVVCLCAWFGALYTLHLKQRRPPPPPPPPPPPASHGGAGEEVVVDVNSKDYKKLVVLKGLLQRDRRQLPAYP